MLVPVKEDSPAENHHKENMLLNYYALFTASTVYLDLYTAPSMMDEKNSETTENEAKQFLRSDIATFALNQSFNSYNSEAKPKLVSQLMTSERQSATRLICGRDVQQRAACSTSSTRNNENFEFQMGVRDAVQRFFQTSAAPDLPHFCCTRTIKKMMQ
ncbi:hypothetical protein Q1695_015189 [Nippostrongylus brasiliensis]|nr:hypothetical protein Q1695_015189 [Nippostrongylus brasiliensis]